MGESGWVIGLLVAFLAGMILGYALKVKQHDREIENILRNTRAARQIAAAKQNETPQGKKPPGRSMFGTL